MFKIKQAAAMMGVSASKLYELVESRRIGHYRVGGTILLSQADIDTFLASCRVGPTAPKAAAPRVQVRLKHIKLS